MKKKTVALLLALVLVIGGVIGGTIAWLTDYAAPVTNTFTPSTINIELNETKPVDKTVKMVPGDTIEKDPTVTVVEGSEPCWLFIKVEASANADTFLTYAVDTSIWAPVPDHTGYWYCKVNASAGDVTHHILADDKVMVNEDVTKAAMDELNTATQPTLAFTAAAIQEAHIADVATAWNNLPAEFTP